MLLLMIFLSFSQFSAVSGNSQFVVYKTTNVECLLHPEYAVNVSCVLKARNWNKAVAQMECYLIKTLYNTTAHIEVFKKGYNNRYHPFLVNSTVNMCDVILKRNYFIYGTIFWKILKQYTNVNHSCPFSGHLVARDLYIDSNNTLLPKLPLGFYLISISVFEGFTRGPSDKVASLKYYIQSMEMVKTKGKRA